jgi:hypothetical protein
MTNEQKKEGYLAEKTLWGFKKRFCVLKDGILFVFAEKVRFIHTLPRTALAHQLIPWLGESSTKDGR